MADIFEEVDEELKQDNFKKLWDRYGRYAVAAIVLIVAGTAANEGWRSYTTSQRHANSERFIAAIALAEQDKHADAAAALAVFAEEASDGYAMLARFREAAVRRTMGDIAAAIDIYESLASDESLEPLYRDLAVLLSVMSQVDTGDPAALEDRLKPLLGNGAWRHTAAEYLGLIALRRGDVAAARERFQAIADDLEAPQGARARAAELLQSLEN